MIDDGHGEAEAVVPDDVLGGYAHVRERHRRRGRAPDAELFLLGSGGQALGLARDHDGADGLVLPREDGEHAGDAAVRDPDLLAVQDDVVAVAHELRAQRAGVRSRLGLGECVRRNPLAGRALGKPLRFLLGRARQEERLDPDGLMRTQRDRGRAAVRRDLGEDAAIGADAQAEAPVLLGDDEPEQTELLHALKDGLGELALAVDRLGVHHALQEAVEGREQQRHRLLVFGRRGEAQRLLVQPALEQTGDETL